MGFETARAYFTLTKPGITAFIVMVAVAGFFTVSPSQIDLRSLLWLVVAGWLGSAGSSALNHWYDVDIDAKMHRTMGRPLPSEKVPRIAALLLGIALLALSLALAATLLNLYVAAAIASGAIMYVVIYTVLLKRTSRWGIVIGGYAGSAAVLGGGAAVTGTFPYPVILLAILVFLWTPPHFWSLAIAFSSDYGEIGLPVLPKKGDLPESARRAAGSAALLLAPTAFFAFLRLSYFVFFVAALVAGLWLVTMTARTIQETTRKNALRAFIASGFYLAAVSGAMVLNWFLAVRLHLGPL